MVKNFTKHCFLVYYMIGCMIMLYANGPIQAGINPLPTHSKSGNEASGSTSERKEINPDPPVYSKSGSDSISLIIFGRVLAPKTVPVATSGAKSSGTSKAEDKSKKKDKFNIKSSDKLKTNHSLY